MVVAKQINKNWCFKVFFKKGVVAVILHFSKKSNVFYSIPEMRNLVFIKKAD